MNKRWLLKAWAAVVVLMVILAVSFMQFVSALQMPVRHYEGVRRAERMVLYPWATVKCNASLHEGPGLDYSIAGMVRNGMAVQVLWQQDGWSKVWAYGHEEPVWVNDGYIAVCN